MLWRQSDEALNTVNTQYKQMTLKRLNLAFQAFFRLVKTGDKSSFPRFKAYNRFPGWGYKTHGDGKCISVKLAS